MAKGRKKGQKKGSKKRYRGGAVITPLPDNEVGPYRQGRPVISVPGGTSAPGSRPAGLFQTLKNIAGSVVGSVRQNRAISTALERSGHPRMARVARFFGVGKKKVAVVRPQVILR